ncbi:MAG: 3-phosphoshikimate 1-carboxyvinyltransferase [Catalinimonas sp.]
MSDSLLLHHPTGRVRADLTPPASKSISNRVLIIDALAGGTSDLQNLSSARDTQTMRRLLTEGGKHLDVGDAGTTMRFLTAYHAVTGSQCVLTGTPRMQERPIGPLVEALQAIGAHIAYEKTPGCPPLHLRGFDYRGKHQTELPGNVSSQFISALLMVAPTLPDGLEINLLGPITSRPYIEMTRALMAAFGVESRWSDGGRTLLVGPQAYAPRPYTVESDWSGASYWYSVVALAPDAEATILLRGLDDESLQGDRRIAGIMRALGVTTEFTAEGAKLSRHDVADEPLVLNFVDCPDLAQTVFAAAAARGVRVRANGLESLRVKETDRLDALQRELAHWGHRLAEDTGGYWTLEPAPAASHEVVTVRTYEDHRMAMAFAPLALLHPVRIETPEVVRKSYPTFWDDLLKTGFEISR